MQKLLLTILNCKKTQKEKKVDSPSIFENNKANESDLNNYFCSIQKSEKEPNETNNAASKETTSKDTKTEEPLTFKQKAWNWTKKAGRYVKDKAIEFWNNNKGAIKTALTSKAMSYILGFIAAV